MAKVRESKPGPVNPQPGPGGTVPGGLLRRFGIDPFQYNENEQAVVTTATPNPRILEKVAREARELFLEAASIGDAEPYAFGTVACKPLVVAADDSGDTLVLDCLWSVGECESVCNGAISAKDIWSPDIGFLSVTGSEFEHFTGTSGQSASTIMTALKGSYDALPDRAHSIISMQDTWNLNFFGFVSGVKVFDPRNSPQVNVFSENPALILADIFSRSGYTIDWDSFAEAADNSDIPTYPDASPNSPRWAIRGHITTKQELRHWVHALAQYAGCYIDVRGGTVICVVDKARASNHTVVAADIVDRTARLKRRGSKNAPEKVTINVLAPGGSTWAASYGASGGAGTESTLFMPYWESIHPAGMKAKEIYLRAQKEIESFEFVGFDDGLIRTLGDVGTITYGPVGLSGVDMALVENEPVDRGRWRRKYIPYDAADYPADTTGATSASAEETVRNPYFPPQGPTPVLSFDTVTSASPNYDRIKIDFSPQTWAYLKDYFVTVTTTTDTATILYSEYIAKGSETGSPETISTYTDFATDFTGSPENVYRVNVYLRSNVSDGLNDVLGAPGTADIASLYETTAKHFGGTSPLAYYYVPDSPSPLVFHGLIDSSSETDYWTKQTLVMSLYFVSISGDGMPIFATGASDTKMEIDADGSLYIRFEDRDGDPQSIYLEPTDSPVFSLGTGEWHNIILGIDNDETTSPESQSWKLWINGTIWYSGVPENQGAFGPEGPSLRAQLKPHSNAQPASKFGQQFGSDDPPNFYASHIWGDRTYLDPEANWDKFFELDGGVYKPIDLGAQGENPTGSQPDIFAPDGDLSAHVGSAALWDEIGVVPNAPISPTD